MKTKFNIIDAIIATVIVLIIAVCVFVYFKFAHKDNAVVNNTTKINFVVEVNNLTEEASDSFENAKGNSVTFGTTASGIGTVAYVEIVPYTKWVKNIQDGEVIISEVPERYTAKVTIESDVVKSDISYTCGSETIAVGKEMPFNAKGAASEDGFIVDLSEVKWGDFYVV